ncbi:MAG: hypothetical protein KG003_05385 [Bacteroidetes bacterium]|nr:hypothetical protein [Bacteroidota bacterium]
MKLQEYLNEIKKEFHLRHGFEFGFTEGQSEAHFDLTTQAAMQYLQGLLMSGKMNEMQQMISSNPEALKDSTFYSDLIQKCTESYYALDWDYEKKKTLAETALGFAIAGLKQRFDEGGYTADSAGVMKFIGLDSGLMGMMGKVGGFFNKFRK